MYRSCLRHMYRRPRRPQMARAMRTHDACAPLPLTLWRSYTCNTELFRRSQCRIPRSKTWQTTCTQFGRPIEKSRNEQNPMTSFGRPILCTAFAIVLCILYLHLSWYQHAPGSAEAGNTKTTVKHRKQPLHAGRARGAGWGRAGRGAAGRGPAGRMSSNTGCTKATRFPHESTEKRFLQVFCVFCKASNQFSARYAEVHVAEVVLVGTIYLRGEI